jgi:hypothetical protein
MAIKIPIVDISLHQHDMANFLRCPKLYDLSSRLGYKPKSENRYLNIGGVFAHTIFWLHRGKSVAECMAYVDSIQQEIVGKAIKQEQINELETDRIIVQAMINGYWNHFLNKKEIKIPVFNELGGIDRIEEIDIIEILPEYELQTQFNVGNYRYTYICRLDGFVSTNAGPFILEIKTTSQVDSNIIHKLPTNFQINSYWLELMRNRCDTICGVFYRFIKKPTIRQKQKETIEQFRRRLIMDYLDRPDNYFYEENLYFTQDVLADFEKYMIHYFNELTRCYITNTWVRNGTSCETEYGVCKFLKYCSNPTKERLAMYYEAAT